MEASFSNERSRPQSDSIWTGTASRLLDRLELVTVTVLVVVALGLYLYGMVTRNFFRDHAAEWAEEITIFLVNWAILISAASLAPRNAHIRTTLFIALFPSTARRILFLAGLVLAMTFCALLGYFSLDVIELSLFMDERGVSALRVPLVYYYLALPVAMALIVLRYLLMLIDCVRDPNAGRDS